jgi:hypothetical protein
LQLVLDWMSTISLSPNRPKGQKVSVELEVPITTIWPPHILK